MIAFIIFVLWRFYDVYGSDSGLIEIDWEYAWVNDAFPEVLFAIIFAAIMVLWRPNLNNARCVLLIGLHLIGSVNRIYI